MKRDLKNVSECPDCNGEVRFRKRPFLGQILACPRCGVSLEVITLDPVELDWADEEEDALEDEYEDSVPPSWSNTYQSNRR